MVGVTATWKDVVARVVLLTGGCRLTMVVSHTQRPEGPADMHI